jgi:formylglycine-generating enzyme
MDDIAADAAQRSKESAQSNMVFVPGGTFRIPEEAPVHQVTVSGFWIDRSPVTNRQFRAFVRATGHVTVAEVAARPSRINLERRNIAVVHQAPFPYLELWNCLRR